ncbi:MAG TPA: HAD-IIB family hydrolase [Candidatus Saccharimonas sp.]|jgi:phosphomannomutase|nr:HAD-IIB family hydrolase [Candidatus Saccharimonas sp.]
MKKIIAFDVDDTLVKSKNPLTPEMVSLLSELMKSYEVAIISGSRFEVFEENIIAPLREKPRELLERMHILPTCGTRYYTYDHEVDTWDIMYAEDFTEEQKQKIVEVSERLTKESGLWPAHPHGEVIEDRLSQIAISMLGQKAPAEEKYEWYAAHNEDAIQLRNKIAAELPEFEVRNGGTTTIDITPIGVDKAYGMQKLIEALDVTKEEVLFVGDRLEKGGNDYPVKAMGVDCIDVDGWQTTPYVVRGILGVTDQ